MKMSKFIGMLCIAFTLTLTACGPKDEDINKEVSSNVAAVAPGVSTSVTDGVVTLSGTVADEQSKASAEEAAKKAKGVKSVNNSITVVAPAPVVVTSPDDQLSTGVADAIKDFPGATATVTDGEIVVTGSLKADEWKRLKMSLDALSPKKVTATSLIIK